MCNERDHPSMAELLIQSCSKRKRENMDALSALERYDGYFFRILRKAKREQLWPQDMELVILSAEHGIIHANDTVQYYDRKMTKTRANKLNEEVLLELKSLVNDHDIQRILVNVGSIYRVALDGLEEVVEPPVQWIEGDGIGAKGHQLKTILESQARKQKRA